MIDKDVIGKKVYSRVILHDSAPPPILKLYLKPPHFKWSIVVGT